MDSNQIFRIGFLCIHYHLCEISSEIIECKIFWSIWTLYNYNYSIWYLCGTISASLSSKVWGWLVSIAARTMLYCWSNLLSLFLYWTFFGGFPHFSKLIGWNYCLRNDSVQSEWHFEKFTPIKLFIKMCIRTYTFYMTDYSMIMFGHSMTGCSMTDYSMIMFGHSMTDYSMIMFVHSMTDYSMTDYSMIETNTYGN